MARSHLPKVVSAFLGGDDFSWCFLEVCWCNICKADIDVLVQDCSISTDNALEILQSCTKPSIYTHMKTAWLGNASLAPLWGNLSIDLFAIEFWQTIHHMSSRTVDTVEGFNWQRFLQNPEQSRFYTTWIRLNIDISAKWQSYLRIDTWKYRSNVPLLSLLDDSKLTKMSCLVAFYSSMMHAKRNSHTKFQRKHSDFGINGLEKRHIYYKKSELC